jgi:hypothetical protein
LMHPRNPASAPASPPPDLGPRHRSRPGGTKRASGLCSGAIILGASASAAQELAQGHRFLMCGRTPAGPTRR